MSPQTSQRIGIENGLSSLRAPVCDLLLLATLVGSLAGCNFRKSASLKEGSENTEGGTTSEQEGGGVASQPSALPNFDLNAVFALLDKELTALRDYEKSNGQPMGAAHDQDRSAIRIFRDDTGREIYVDSEFHGDRKSITNLKEIFLALARKGAKAEQILLIGEDLDRDDVRPPVGFGAHALLQIQNELGCDLVSPIRNVSRWEVVEQIIRNLSDELGDKLDDDSVRQLYLGQAAVNLSVESERPGTFADVLFTVDFASRKWGENTSIEELYRSIERYLDISESERNAKRRIIDRVIFASADTDKGSSRNSFDWSVVERDMGIVLKGAKGITRQDFLGYVMEDLSFALTQPQLRPLNRHLLVSQLFDWNPERRGFPDHSRTFGDLLRNWKGNTSRAELHRATVGLHRRYFEDPKGVSENLSVVARVMHRTQNEMTTAALKQELTGREDIRYVVSVNGYLHTDSVVAGFPGAQEMKDEE